MEHPATYSPLWDLLLTIHKAEGYRLQIPTVRVENGVTITGPALQWVKLDDTPPGKPITTHSQH